MPRQLFTDEYWDKFKTIMLSLGVYEKPSLRQTVEGIFYRLRVGCPCPKPLASGMRCINDSMPGHFKKN